MMDGDCGLCSDATQHSSALCGHTHTLAIVLYACSQPGVLLLLYRCMQLCVSTNVNIRPLLSLAILLSLAWPAAEFQINIRPLLLSLAILLSLAWPAAEFLITSVLIQYIF